MANIFIDLGDGKIIIKVLSAEYSASTGCKNYSGDKDTGPEEMKNESIYITTLAACVSITTNIEAPSIFCTISDKIAALLWS